MIVYLNGQFTSKEDAKVSPDDRGFLLADGVYEVIRSYDGKLFELDGHLQRLERNLQELRIKDIGKDELTAVIQALMHLNHPSSGESLVYIQVTRGVAERSHSFPDHKSSPTVYVSVSPFHPPNEKWKDGVSIILVPDIRWGRCDIKSVALLPNVLANQTAKENGAAEALFVRDGHVTEGTHTNFCGIFDNCLVTHPLNHFVLDGITRRVVLEICSEMRIPVKESPIREDKLKNASELMLLGTTFEVMPVVQVDDWPVAEGRPGPKTAALRNAFRQRTIAR
jgi:D-alanine transaminase